MAISIHPSIGVARLGNSGDPNGPDAGSGEFFLAPDKIGGLPYEYEELSPDGNLTNHVANFKDASGCIKRQGQLFRLFDETGEITTNRDDIESIEWTVHLANKKAAWYQYNELVGNLLYGPSNSYANNGGNELLRNKDYPGNRQELIIDPGPRTLNRPLQQVGFDNNGFEPDGYPTQYPPDNLGPNGGGVPVTTLGELRTDSQGRLIVLGGFGNSGGSEPLTSYGGSDSWHDDISDGPVYCTVTYTNRDTEDLQAWVIIGSPDFAPEIVNISTLSDTMFDVGVRHFNLVPGMRNGNDWNTSYRAHFERDILPIIQRIKGYQWVSNVQSMSAFFANNFDFTDNDNRPTSPASINRLNYVSYFRHPNGEGGSDSSGNQEQLFHNGTDFPMMPLNSGSNSVSNDTIVKFLALNETQYFLLMQWAVGLFDSDPDYEPESDPDAVVHPLDAASVGNCVGLPMCPGIEVTWTVQNPAIYESPYVIKHARDKDGYNTTGLTPMRDECDDAANASIGNGELGCEPGDLTKRMACPWQADFFQCTIQHINFTDPNVNKENGIPKPPTYYSYWWPPQSPWDVLTGETTAAGQYTSNSYQPPSEWGDSFVPQNPVYIPAGQQLNYARGINSFVQMVEHWYALGFIRNQHPSDTDYPYLVETERNHELFTYQEVPVGAITGNTYDNDTTIPVFSMTQDMTEIHSKSERGQRLVAYLEERAFKAIQIAPEALSRHPRSGTRARR